MGAAVQGVDTVRAKTEWSVVAVQRIHAEITWFNMQRQSKRSALHTLVRV